MLWGFVDEQILVEITLESRVTAMTSAKPCSKSDFQCFFPSQAQEIVMSTQLFWVGLNAVLDEFFSNARHAGSSFEV